MKLAIRAAIGATALVHITAPAAAADRALLVGVGTYATPGNDLPGIDKDIAQMRDVVQRLGFRQPTVLRDDQATRRAILDSMKQTLVDGVEPNDRILIYFSGHGSQAQDDNGDEPDQLDEVLVAHDVRFSRDSNGAAEIRGVITDDEIGKLLAQSPSHNIMLIIDSCHSGTIDKAFSLAQPVMGSAIGVPKFLKWERSGPVNRGFNPEAKADAQTRGHYVSLNAAGDNQSAIAMSNGSVFTVGLAQAIAASSAKGTITPAEMVRQAQAYILANVRAGQTFNPEIQGSDELKTRAIQLSGTSSGNGPNWTRVSEIAAGLPPLKLEGVAERYTDGQRLAFTIESPSDGYLNVLNVNPDDTITLLYPNKYNPDNRITAGVVRIPTEQMPFTLPARAPYGKAMLVAIVTKQPFNLMNTSVDAAGSAPALATPSLGALIDVGRAINRGFSVEGKEDAGGGGGTSAAWAAKLVTAVCSTGSECR